jgi:uncharacterized protein
MRISSLSGLICFSLALLPGGAMALEAARPQAMAPAKSYSSALDALRSGVRDYNKGNKLVAAQALEYAATQGPSRSGSSGACMPMATASITMI